MEFDPIEQVSFEQQHLMRMAQRRTCAILAADSREAYPSKMGTGTAVAHAGNIFVVSCSHVIGDMLSHGVGWMAFFTPLVQVDRGECRVVFDDKVLDLAVLRIDRQAAQRLTELVPLLIDDLATEGHFEAVELGARVAFTGLPGKLLSREGDSTVINATPFTLESVAVSKRGSNLWLDYQHCRRNGVVFDPSGSSGAMVYELFSTAPSREIWRPGLGLAIMHHWDDQMEDLVCSSVHHLRQAIAGSR